MQGAKELYLHVEGKLSDLVQKQRPTVGFLEFAQVLAGRAGEGTFLVTKENAFHEICGNGAAIDGDERFATALAFALNGACDHFLAHARLAFNEHGDRRLRGAAAKADHVRHRGARDDEVVKHEDAADLRLQPPYLLGQGRDLQQVLDRYSQTFLRYGLNHEIVGSGAHGANDGFNRALRGLHDDRQCATDGLKLFEKLQAIHAGHDKIEYDQLDARGLPAGHQLKPLGAAVA